MMKKKSFCIVLVIILLLNLSVVFATETSTTVEDNLMLTTYDNVEDIAEEPMVIGILDDNNFKDSNEILLDEDVNLSNININGNLVIFAKNVDLQNVNVNGDVAIFGETIKISNLNITNGATLIAGQNITLNMITSTGNVYTAGENITATANANGLYLAGADIELGNESQISKLYNYSANLSIKGGNYDRVEASVNDLYVGPNTVISENLKYTSSNEGNIDTSANIANIDFTKSLQNDEEDIETVADILKDKVYNVFTLVVKSALVCGFIFLFATGLINKTKTENSVKYLGLATLKGLGWTVLVPIIAICLLISGLAIGTSFAVIAVYVLIFWASVPLVSIVIMNMITKNMPENKWKNYGIALLVALVIGVLGEIPTIGGIVTVLVGFAGMGIFFNSLNPNKTKKNEAKVEVVEEKKEDDSKGE